MYPLWTNLELLPEYMHDSVRELNSRARLMNERLELANDDDAHKGMPTEAYRKLCDSILIDIEWLQARTALIIDLATDTREDHADE